MKKLITFLQKELQSLKKEFKKLDFSFGIHSSTSTIYIIVSNDDLIKTIEYRRKQFKLRNMLNDMFPENDFLFISTQSNQEFSGDTIYSTKLESDKSSFVFDGLSNTYIVDFKSSNFNKAIHSIESKIDAYEYIEQKITSNSFEEDYFLAA